MSEAAIPVVVEPPLLAFELNLLLRSEESSVRTFMKFTSSIRAFFDALDRTNTRIALTEELYRLFLQQVPLSAYEAAQNSKVVVELLQRRFRERMRVVHKFGAHGYEVNVSEGITDPNGMLTSNEVYVHWVDLVGLIPLDKLPAIILHDPSATLLNPRECRICTTQKTEATVSVCGDITSRQATVAIAAWKLALKIKQVPASSVPCSGTGGHSSMWGDLRIKTLDDVPAFERSLLTALVETGLVTEIKLLSFDVPRPAVAEPFIELVQPGDATPTGAISGLLRGKGEKENAQRLSLKVIPEIAPLVLSAFGKEIRLKDVDRLRQLSAALKGRRAR